MHIFVTFFTIPFFIGALIVGYVSFTEYETAISFINEKENFISQPAKLLAVEIEKEEGNTFYYAKYKYTYKGDLYESESIYFNANFVPDKYLEALGEFLLNSYDNHDQNITVWLNKSLPKESYITLECNLFSGLTLIVFSIVFLLVPTAINYVFWKNYIDSAT